MDLLRHKCVLAVTKEEYTTCVRLPATRATGADPGADSELCYNCYKEQKPEFPLDMTYHPYTVVFAVGKDGEMTVKQAYATRGLGNCSVELCVLEQNGPQI
jgi:hypothetical protein